MTWETVAMRRNISDPSFDFATFMPRFGDASPWLFTTSAFAWLAPCAALALASVADAAAQNVQSTVYKCTQANGLASYQDFPCKGGVVVDIKPDVADPAAIKRLERAQEAFNRGAALRQAQEIEALRREQLTRQRREIDAQQEPAPFYGADPGLKVVVVRVGNPQELDPAAAHERHRIDDVVRRHRDMLNAGAAVILQVLFDLGPALSGGRLVDRELDAAVPVRHHLRHQRRVLRPDVFIVEVLV
jgi:hypothetical protein